MTMQPHDRKLYTSPYIYRRPSDGIVIPSSTVDAARDGLEPGESNIIPLPSPHPDHHVRPIITPVLRKATIWDRILWVLRGR